MKSDRRLTDCMRLNLTCDPECERTVSHLPLPARQLFATKPAQRQAWYSTRFGVKIRNWRVTSAHGALSPVSLRYRYFGGTKI